MYIFVFILEKFDFDLRLTGWDWAFPVAVNAQLSGLPCHLQDEIVVEAAVRSEDKRFYHRV